MLKPFSKYLRTQGKAANTAAAYCRDVSLYLKWCQAAFGEQPARLYRANVLEYISFLSLFFKKLCIFGALRLWDIHGIHGLLNRQF